MKKLYYIYIYIMGKKRSSFELSTVIRIWVYMGEEEHPSPSARRCPDPCHLPKAAFGRCSPTHGFFDAWPRYHDRCTRQLQMGHGTQSHEAQRRQAPLSLARNSRSVHESRVPRLQLSRSHSDCSRWRASEGWASSAAAKRGRSNLGLGGATATVGRRSAGVKAVRPAARTYIWYTVLYGYNRTP